MNGALGLLISAVIGAEGVLPPTPPPIHPPSISATRQGTEAQERWELSLSEALFIGLDNSEVVRVVSYSRPCEVQCEGGKVVTIGGERIVGDFEPGRIRAACPAEGSNRTERAPVVIAQLSRDVDPWRFKAEVMAHLRSIEQQYWYLAEQQDQLRSSGQAVELAEAVVTREQALLEDGSGTLAAVEEARQRLEQFRLDQVSKRSDVATTERQLRNILGLSPNDRRRIVPVTPPVEEPRNPDWDECLATLRQQQPDVILQDQVVGKAQAYALASHGRALLADLFGTPESRAAASEEARQAIDTLRRQHDYQGQVLHQTVHVLARFFLEIDANYKQFQTAGRLRAAATRRLEVQRAFFNEGRITIDRYLDAISQFAGATAQEAQFRTSYNVSLAALEEVKGTLLSSKNVFIICDARPDPRPGSLVLSPGEGVRPAAADTPAPAPALDPALVRTGFEAAPKAPMSSGAGEPAESADRPRECPPAGNAATTFSFRLSTGGPNPRLIRGELTISPPSPDAEDTPRP